MTPLVHDRAQRPAESTTASPRLSEADHEAMVPVVLGAGPLGRAVAAELAGQGLRPRLVNRSGGTAAGQAIIALGGQLERAFAGMPPGQAVRLFVCAAPAYTRWAEEFPALVKELDRALGPRRADIVLADNLYAYGRQSGPWDEDTTPHPCSEKGRVRDGVAKALLGWHDAAATATQGRRVAMVRSASFYGPGVENSALGGPALRALLAGRPVPLLGDPQQPHALSYIDDAARTLVRVAERPESFGRTWHVPSLPARSLQQWLEDFAKAASAPEPRLRVAGPLLVRLLGLVNPTMRALHETLYLFQQPVLLDSEHSARSLGLAATPAATAMAATIDWLRSPAGAGAART